MTEEENRSLVAMAHCLESCAEDVHQGQMPVSALVEIAQEAAYLIFSVVKDDS